MIVYFYLKTKPFKQENNLVYISGYVLHYDNYIEYETDAVITVDTDFYLDLLLLKSKHKKYTFLSMSKEMFVKSNPVNITEGKISGQAKNGEYIILEEI
jgi:hypothetical protein